MQMNTNISILKNNNHVNIINIFSYYTNKSRTNQFINYAYNIIISMIIKYNIRIFHT